MQQQAPHSRPYRSHLRPACVPCRKRKSRCQTEPASDICLMCRAHATECSFPPNPSSGSSSTRPPDSARRRRASQAVASAGINAGNTNTTSGLPATTPSVSLPNVTIRESHVTQQTFQNPVPLGISPDAVRNIGWTPQNQEGPPEDESPLALGSVNDQPHNLHIVGPAVTSDNQVLSDYLSAMPGATRGSRLVAPVPGNRSRPVLFTMVQKKPLGLTPGRSPSADKLDIIEKLLEPHCEEMVDL